MARLIKILLLVIIANTGMAQVQTIYDSQSRILSVTYPDGSWIKYRYDDAGNRISQTVQSPCAQTVSPTVSVSLNSLDSFCITSGISFSSTITNGGNAPVYQWKKNGVNVGTGNASYSAGGFNDGDSIWLEVISNVNCAVTTPVKSNVIKVHPKPVATPTAQVTASQSTICAGTNVTFTAAITNGGITPIFRWYKNGTLMSASTSIYTDNALHSHDSVWVLITSNATCISNSQVKSSAVIIDTAASVMPAAIVTANSATVCAGATVTFNTNVINGGTGPVLQWYKNGTAVGTGAQTYTTTYNPADSVWVVVTSNATCVNPASATSNKLHLAIDTNSAAGVNVTNTGAVCAGASVTFNANVTNGGNSPVYQWYKNNIAVGSNIPVYTDNTLSSADMVWVKVTSSNTCSGIATSTHQSVTVTALTTPAVSITAGNNPACFGGSDTYTATTQNSGSAPSYQWYLNGAAVGTNSNVYTDNNVSVGDWVKCVLTSNATCQTAQLGISNIIDLAVNQVQSPAVHQSGDSLISDNATGNQWYLNGNAITDATGQVYIPQTNGSYYAVVTDGSGCNSNPSNSFSVTTLGVSVLTDATINIFPNPSHNMVFLNSTGPVITSYKVIDLLGQTLLSGSINATNYKLNLFNLSNGNYIIQLNTTSGSLNKIIALIAE